MTARRTLPSLPSLLCVLSLCACAPPTLRPFPARPVLRVDDDRRPVDRAPRPFTRSATARILAHQVAEPLDRWFQAGTPSTARNVNALGEVPDSSWFTHRQRRTRLDADAVRRGAARTDGPSLLGAWKIHRAGRDAAGPFLVIRDEDRHRFELRFDAPGGPRLATTASLVSTLLLHALGYHVPERHLVIFTASQPVLTRGSVWVRGPVRLGRKKRPLTRADLRALLRPLPRLRDGSLRAVATRLPNAKNLGPFRWRGTREGDPNDFVRHERRRELRGLWPIAAWLNLTGVTDAMPRDLYLKRPRYVRHLLWGLRGSLGSTRAGTPKPLWEGHVTRLSLGRVLAQVVSLGNLRRPWAGLRGTRAWQSRRYPSLGWLPHRTFRAATWRPRLSNAAFAAATPRDHQWGARRVASLSAAQIRAAVAAAYLPKREAERLVRTLLHRRRLVLQQWLAGRAPLARVRLDARTRRLCVTDLWRRERLPGPASPRYETRMRPAPTFAPQSARDHRARDARFCFTLPTPRHARQRWGRYAVLELRRPDVSPHWLRIHLRFGAGRLSLAGIER